MTSESVWARDRKWELLLKRHFLQETVPPPLLRKTWCPGSGDTKKVSPLSHVHSIPYHRELSDCGHRNADRSVDRSTAKLACWHGGEGSSPGKRTRLSLFLFWTAVGPGDLSLTRASTRGDGKSPIRLGRPFSPNTLACRRIAHPTTQTPLITSLP